MVLSFAGTIETTYHQNGLRSHLSQNAADKNSGNIATQNMGACMRKENHFCGSNEHFSRRSLLKIVGLSGLSWLTPVASQLAVSAEKNPAKRAKSLIVLWLEGAPSQLETFDPHPDTEIAAGSRARKTNAPGIWVGDGLEQVAEQMDSIALVRAVTSKEGDHERAIYNVKTGFRPDPTLVHPAIGSIICHELNTEQDREVAIPRHVSILPASAPGRGGLPRSRRISHMHSCRLARR